jgi:steroid 5-alpha reductase family enzyme
MLWDYILILFIVGLVLCAVGLYKSEYFGTLSYGFTIAGMGVGMLTLHMMHMFDATWPNYVMIALIILYGIRISTVSMLKETEKKEKEMPFYFRAIAWVIATVLYVSRVLPIFFTVEGEYGYYPGACMWVGMILCVVGMGFAVLSDVLTWKEKKTKEITSWKEIYQVFFVPEYLAEFLFWTGVLISSLDSLKGAGEWLIAILGFLAAIVLKAMKYTKRAFS